MEGWARRRLGVSDHEKEPGVQSDEKRYDQEVNGVIIGASTEE
jgi:hypothetical protein